jgi:hypothetical protein
MVRISGIACRVVLDRVVMDRTSADAEEYSPSLEGDVRLKSLRAWKFGFQVDMVVIGPTLKRRGGVIG